MNLYEAYEISTEENSTFNQLLEAYGLFREEKGYLLAIATRQLENGMQLEMKIWQLLLVGENLKIKIQNKIKNTD